MNLMYNSDDCKKSKTDCFIKQQESANITLKLCEGITKYCSRWVKALKKFSSGLFFAHNLFPLTLTLIFTCVPPRGAMCFLMKLLSTAGVYKGGIFKGLKFQFLLSKSDRQVCSPTLQPPVGGNQKKCLHPALSYLCWKQMLIFNTQFSLTSNWQ